MNTLRVLIDTNILLSGLIWNGNESHLLEMSVDGEICLLIPEFVIEEARRVLELKFKEHVHLLDEVLGLLNYVCLQHPSEGSIESARAVLRDPKDAEILASIIEYKPDYALTGDKDLLTNDVQSIFPICRCADFLREFKRD
jgi:putative PIN family toxin of toxin-antitoxin system